MSRDQTKLTGHMILKKGEPSYPGDMRGNILGKENLGKKNKVHRLFVEIFLKGKKSPSFFYLDIISIICYAY